MDKKPINILGLALVIFLTTLSTGACAPKQASFTVPTWLASPLPALLTEAKAIANALTYFPPDVVTVNTRISTVLDMEAGEEGE